MATGTRALNVTAEQLELLRALGCDDIQGYLMARPLHAGQVPEFLGRENLMSVMHHGAR